MSKTKKNITHNTSKMRTSGVRKNKGILQYGILNTEILDGDT